MDGDLILIFGFILAALIIVGFSVNALVGKTLAHKRWEKENEQLCSQASVAQGSLADRTDMIEDRLRVLERLATDRGTLLADEIDALRDDRKALTSSKDQETT